MTEMALGAEPVTVVELVQPRCSLRFGTAPCTATGMPKCYQTFWTCKDRQNYTPDGSIRWRLCEDTAARFPLYEAPNANDIRTNALPCVLSVTTNPTKINIGAIRDGESPFSLRGAVTIRCSNPPWPDPVGDFYIGDRTGANLGTFFGLLVARNDVFNDVRINIYEGYLGQALSAMQRREYMLEAVEGPDGAGHYTIKGVDPLQYADRIRALYPRTSDLELVDGIAAADTANVRMFGSGADLTRDLGNVTVRRFLRIGSEIIRYVGITSEGSGVYLLTGVARGQLGTEAADHTAGDAAQRVARFEDVTCYDAADIILRGDPAFPVEFIDNDQWDEEGGLYLYNNRLTATIAEPTAAEDLLGELCRDGLMSMWFEEKDQKIRILAVRPPNEGVTEIDDERNILAGGFGSMTEPRDRLTRVTVFFGVLDPTGGQDDIGNYRQRYSVVEAEFEDPKGSDGTARELRVFSRWLQSTTTARLFSAQMLLRYKRPPRYVTIRLDAKDRALGIGDVIDLSSREFLDIEGKPDRRRWQVISAEEVEPGNSVVLDLQSYEFFGRFGRLMADGAPDYADATEAQRAEGFWLCNDDLTMGNGDEPYRLS